MTGPEDFPGYPENAPQSPEMERPLTDETRRRIIAAIEERVGPAGGKKAYELDDAEYDTVEVIYDPSGEAYRTDLVTDAIGEIALHPKSDNDTARLSTEIFYLCTSPDGLQLEKHTRAIDPDMLRRLYGIEGHAIIARERRAAQDERAMGLSVVGELQGQRVATLLEQAKNELPA